MRRRLRDPDRRGRGADGADAAHDSLLRGDRPAPGPPDRRKGAHRAYDDGGRLIETDFGNGIVERRGYVAGDNLIASIVASSIAMRIVLTSSFNVRNLRLRR